MYIDELNLTIIIFIKKLLKNYNLFRTRITNKYYQNKYQFKNLNYAIVHNYDDIVKFKENNKKISDECAELDRLNIEGTLKNGKKHGWCCFCNQETDFIWQTMPRYSDHILFTETFHCPKCGLPNRIRAIFHLLKIFEKSNPKNKKIYCYEKNTWFFDYLKSSYGSNNEIIGSEYFGADKIPGEIINGTRHEDCMNLSFKDNELDYIISNDVFEHVPDIDKALREALRCLNKGGKLLIRIPLELSMEHTLKRAEIVNGEIIYNAPKEYHGGFSFEDPNGCLAFYTYGRDIFDILEKTGFSKTYGIVIQDEKFVNIGVEPLIIFICEK